MTRRSRSVREIVRALAPYVWLPGRLDLKARILIAIGLMVAAKLVRVSAPFFYQGAVDGLTVQQGVEAAVIAAPVLLILGYAGVRMSGELLAYIRNAIFAKVREALSRALSSRIFDHLHTLSSRFHVERRTGALTRVVDRGIAPVNFVLSVVLFQIIPSIIELILVVIILYNVFGPAYVLVTVTTVVVFVAYTFFISEWRKHLRRELNDIQTDASGKAVDSIINYETVKYFSNEDYELRRYDTAMASLEQANIRWSFSEVILNSGQSVILAVTLGVLMLMAGFDVAAGAMTVGSFVMINALIVQLYGPLNSLGFVYRQIQEAFIDTERLLDILDTTPEVNDKPGAKPLDIHHGEVRFEGVEFSYNEDRTILHGLDFTVPSGATIAVVGPTGAGKSTLSRILFRMYDVTAGRVTIDGQDVRDVTQESLRAAIGMVPQDTVLFNDTIGYNIRYGRPGASDDDVREAARLAQIDAFIESLPKGYDTVVGERGLKLSGGEKQRVAIARTLLKNPPILILDEATSALDTQTEQEIQAALETVSQNRTALVIAHRLSTVMSADDIIVLDKGRIAERGTHADLIAKQGLYAQMWARQKEIDEAERILSAAGKNPKPS